MFSIVDYALPAEAAELVADEIRDHIAAAARAHEDIERLRAELIRERETSETYRAALRIYGWTDGSNRSPSG